MSPLSVVASTWSYFPFASKSQSGVFDNAKIDQSIQLTLRALDEDCRGESDVALDMYFEALSRMFEALPESQDIKRNNLIKHKFSCLISKKFNDLNTVQPPALRRPVSESNLRIRDIPYGNADYDALEVSCELKQSASLSEKVVKAAVAGAVALKQSPIPDVIYSGVGFTLRKAQAIDKYIGVQNLCWSVSKVGLNKALELDAQYNLHEKVSSALMTSATAVIKAGIAYKEASSYQELKSSSTCKP